MASAAARKIQQAFRSRKTGFVNETHYASDGYKLSTPVITARTVTLYFPWGAFVLPASLPAGIASVEGRTLIGNPATCRLTKTHGVVGSPVGVNHWNFRIEGGGAAVFHKSGSLQITTSGKSTYEPVLRKIATRFFPGARVNISNVKMTKLDGRINIDHTLRLDEFVAQFIRHVPHTVGTASLDEELFPAAIVHWKQPAMTLSFFTNGNVLIRGTRDLSVVPSVIHRIIQYTGPLNIFKRERARNMAGRPMVNEAGRPVYEPLAATRMRNIPVSARNKNAQKLAKLNTRYPKARSYSNTRNGKYVRPGPNGLPRFYPVVTNMSLVRQKVLRAYETHGVDIPPSVMRLFNVEGANLWEALNMPGPAPVAPKIKSPPRRAPNWNANRPGFYVRPGPGKQPYFYKVPAGKAAGKKTVLKAYANAGVPVPQRVRNIFGINGNASPSARAAIKVNGDRINGKQYSRYTIAQLVRMARNMNIAGASENKTAAQIFKMIKNKVGPSPNSAGPSRPNLVLNGKAYTFTNNNRILRNGRARQFNTLTRAERLAVAKAYLKHNYGNFESKPPKTWYAALKNIKATRGPVPSPSPSPSPPAPAPAPRSRTPSPVYVNMPRFL